MIDAMVFKENFPYSDWSCCRVCGINFAENKTIGKISWDIIHPDFQGKSLGTKLLKYRIEVLKTIPGIQKITVRTLQVAYKFYEK